MISTPSRRTLLGAAGLLVATPAFAADPMQSVLDYAQGQGTTGFLVIRDRKVLAEKNWPGPAKDEPFKSAYTYGVLPDGELLEDVASQQKSFVSMLIAVGIDKGLIDVERPVSDYVGSGWAKVTPEQEKAIKLIHVLNMASGLTERFTFEAAPGAKFFYNTPVYAVTKLVVAAAAKQPLEKITTDWLTAPSGMANTAWRQRPAAFAGVGNPTGLVTCPRDVATFGQIVLDGGKARSGKTIVSESALKAMFARSATNPAYGRLWWLNGSTETIRAEGRQPGQLIPAAPADTVAALGAMGRKLYVSPSSKLIVVRMGQQPKDRDFDQQLWLRLAKALA